VKESTLGQVSRAAEAARVGGHSAACPAGMTAISGLCFEVDSRPSASFGVAADDCSGEQRLLPSPAQLAVAANVLPIASGNGEWTDSFYVVPPSDSRALGVRDDGSRISRAITAELPYRCAVPLLR
jgi:hypothetical protein